MSRIHSEFVACASYCSRADEVLVREVPEEEDDDEDEEGNDDSGGDGEEDDGSDGYSE
jgi:hypothetical protein